MTKIQEICQGLKIIEQYKADDCPEFQHDVMYAGLGVYESMLDEDKKKMEELSWNYDEENDCWQHF
jgi:hypothetical protein